MVIDTSHRLATSGSLRDGQRRDRCWWCDSVTSVEAGGVEVMLLCFWKICDKTIGIFFMVSVHRTYGITMPVRDSYC